MVGRVSSHLRQHGIAYAALFIVLGGTAVALPGKNTVDSGDIAKKAVKSSDIAKKAVKKKNIANGAVITDKLADGAVATGKLADGAVATAKLDAEAVTGAKADEASFEGLVKGDGRQSTASFTVDAVGFLPTSIVLATVPTMGVVELIACFPDSPSGASDIRTRLLSFDDSAPFFGAGTVISSATPSGAAPGTRSDQTAGLFSSGGGNPLIAESPDPTNAGLGVSGWWDWHLSRGTADGTVGAHVTVSGYNSSTAGSPNGQCTVTATVEYQD